MRNAQSWRWVRELVAVVAIGCALAAADACAYEYNETVYKVDCSSGWPAIVNVAVNVEGLSQVNIEPILAGKTVSALHEIYPGWFFTLWSWNGTGDIDFTAQSCQGIPSSGSCSSPYSFTCVATVLHSPSDDPIKTAVLAVGSTLTAVNTSVAGATTATTAVKGAVETLQTHVDSIRTAVDVSLTPGVNWVQVGQYFAGALAIVLGLYFTAYAAGQIIDMIRHAK
jgi:hypothetical protein